jgi:hypothetical protein
MRQGTSAKGAETAGSRGRMLLARSAALAICAALSIGARGAAAEDSGAPSNVAAPAIAGHAVDEVTVSAGRGKWSGATPIAYGYQWELCDSSGAGCTDLTGATNHQYRVQHADVGGTLRVIVTATNGTGAASATSAPSAVVAPTRPKRAKQPSITGAAVDGRLLTAGAGTWKGTPPFTYAYQWQACIRTKCAAIAGATEPTYRVTTAQIGEQLRVLVTAANSLGSASDTSPATKKALAGSPVNVQAPSVSGTPVDGQTLTASTGAWAGTPPLTYSYQWRSCTLAGGECSDISGATEPTYTAGPTDVGAALEVLVTATSPYGSASAESERVTVLGASPRNVAPPSISGTAAEGQLLTATSGTWSGTEPILYSYQWELCNASGEKCEDIVGAALPTLLLGNEDIGHTVRVVVTASNIAGSLATSSEASPVIAAVAPKDVLAPSVLGLPIAGGTLTATSGLWSGSEPISYAYQWQECSGSGEKCENVTGATGSSYEIAAGEVGDAIRVIVSASNAGGSESAASAATAAVSGVAPKNTTSPAISGEAKAGQLLTASSGTWSGTEPILYSYQWELCNASGEKCENIVGAALPTLLLGSEDIGHTVRVAVTASNIAGSATATSTASAPVKAIPPANLTAPVIAGLPLSGQTLTATSGVWSGSEPISYAYQWQECNATGEDCGDISGATKSTFALTSSYVGHTVRVTVTASNAGGSSPASSLAELIAL